MQNIYLNNNPIWPRPVYIPIPESDTETKTPYISLNGTWKFTDKPPVEYWSNNTDTSLWNDVIVPAELFALGYDIRRNKEYVYKKQIEVPLQMRDRKIILKIGMAYEFSKVWVNGEFVREHGGGFTSFDCDITGFVTAGETAWITVMCMQREDALCDFTGIEGSRGYAGLIDNIGILSLPQDCITRFHYVTDFDQDYKDAILKVTIGVELYTTVYAKVKLVLKDKNGEFVDINPSEVILSRENKEVTADVPISSPLKWDAEHPNLYYLIAELEVDGKVTQSFKRKVGFRKVEKIGNNLYINGIKTKLRGVARYSHDPILGKTFTDEQLELEVQAIKYANMNFIRSSAYPEREKLYDLCDTYGVYVEECAPANFQRGSWDSQKDMTVRHTSDVPNYKAEYMNQFSEMVERDRSHPSVIIWEYANESDWGVNFQAELDYLKIEDSSRLTAGTWDNKNTTLSSYHYPEYNEVFNNASLYDEFVHLAAHALKAITRDPSIRNAWGLSLSKGWEVLFPTDGFIGSAIFALGDYVIMRPKGDVFAREFGQWGLIDAWYREKPELWLTKKAYSPIRIKDKTIENPGEGKQLNIPVKNWYDNTNFNELKFSWMIGDQRGSFDNIGVEPGGEGILVVPERKWTNGDVVVISIEDWQGMLIDKYELTICSVGPIKSFKDVQGPAPVINETEKSIILSGKNFNIVFSKETGLITSGTFKGNNLIKSGPYLNLYGMYYQSSDFSKDRNGEFEVKYSEWQLDSISAETHDKEAVVYIRGRYPGGIHKDIWGFEFGFDPITVDFEVRVDGTGLITTNYIIQNPPKHCLNEVGVFYVLTDNIDRLTWDRDALYSVYPKDHIGRPKGVAYRFRGYGKDSYRVKPEWGWAYDESDFVFYGGGDKGGHCTNDFRSSRENIWFASAVMAQSESRVRAESDGRSMCVRVGPARDEDVGLPEGIKFTMNNMMYYDLGNGSNPSKTGGGYLGNYTYSDILLQPGYKNTVKMRLVDNDNYAEEAYF